METVNIVVWCNKVRSRSILLGVWQRGVSFDQKFKSSLPETREGKGDIERGNGMMTRRVAFLHSGAPPSRGGLR